MENIHTKQPEQPVVDSFLEVTSRDYLSNFMNGQGITDEVLQGLKVAEREKVVEDMSIKAADFITSLSSMTGLSQEDAIATANNMYKKVDFPLTSTNMPKEEKVLYETANNEIARSQEMAKEEVYAFKSVAEFSDKLPRKYREYMGDEGKAGRPLTDILKEFQTQVGLEPTGLMTEELANKLQKSEWGQGTLKDFLLPEEDIASLDFLMDRLSSWEGDKYHTDMMGKQTTAGGINLTDNPEFSKYFEEKEVDPTGDFESVRPAVREAIKQEYLSPLRKEVPEWEELDLTQRAVLLSRKMNTGTTYKKAAKAFAEYNKNPTDANRKKIVKEMRTKVGGKYIPGLDNRVAKELYIAGVITSISDAKNLGLSHVDSRSGLPE